MQKIWAKFLKKLRKLEDPLLDFIFRCAWVDHKINNGQLSIKIHVEYAFFKDWLDENKHLWEPIFHEFFPAVELIIGFELKSI